MKIKPFSPVFPLAGFTDKAFCRLSLWNFKEKASTIFYNTAKKIRFCQGMWLLYLHSRVKRKSFLRFPVGRLYGWGMSLVLFLWNFKKKHQAFPTNTAKTKGEKAFTSSPFFIRSNPNKALSSAQRLTATGKICKKDSIGTTQPRLPDLPSRFRIKKIGSVQVYGW